MSTPVLSSADLRQRLDSATPPHACAYLAMYSSHWGGIVTDARWMLVPADDHLVHRGDGVFETVLFEAGRIYNVQAHLTRLRHSASTIGLPLAASDAELSDLLMDLFAAAGAVRALGRILLGRGPGGFGVDPAESSCPSLYAVAYKAPLPFMDKHPQGASVVYSRVPPKSGGLATIKTCNYLPNALMKAEATARGAHFALGLDEEGFVTESFTENIAAVDETGALVIPPPLRHLPGTTLQRVAELAASEGIPVREQRLRPADLESMKELLVIGTTAYVTSVTLLEETAYPVGPVARRMDSLLRRDIAGG